MSGLFRIRTNVSATFVRRNLHSQNRELSEANQALLSGRRINEASDDAAGLAISQKQRTQSLGYRQSIENAQQDISMLQTAEGGLEKIQSNLQRMRELAIQASNDSLTDSDRRGLQDELESIMRDIDQIAQTTEFNGRPLLTNAFLTEEADPDFGTVANLTPNSEFNSFDASASTPDRWNPGSSTTSRLEREDEVVSRGGNSQRFVDPTSSASGREILSDQFDVNPGERLFLGVSARLATNGEDTGDLDTSSSESDNPANASLLARIEYFDSDGNSIEQNTTNAHSFEEIGSFETFVFKTFDVAGSPEEFVVPDNAETARVEFGVRDGDAGANTVDRDIMMDAPWAIRSGNGELTFHMGANRDETITLNDSDELQAVTSGTLGVSGLSIATRGGAEYSIEQVSNAIDTVSDIRARLGAKINRVKGGIDSLRTQNNNVQKSRSRIKDADFARQSTRRSQKNILLQTGQAMLSQVNTQPSVALQLL
ncbi:MAG: flagellin [bacterium]